MELTKEEALLISQIEWDNTLDGELYKLAWKNIREEVELLRTKYKREKEQAKPFKTSIEVEISGVKISESKFSFYYNIIKDNETLLAAKYLEYHLWGKNFKSHLKELIDYRAVEIALREFGLKN